MTKFERAYVRFMRYNRNEVASNPHEMRLFEYRVREFIDLMVLQIGGYVSFDKHSRTYTIGKEGKEVKVTYVCPMMGRPFLDKEVGLGFYCSETNGDSIHANEGRFGLYDFVKWMEDIFSANLFMDLIY